MFASELREALIGTAVEGTGAVRYHLRELLGEGGQGFVYKANYDDPDGFWIVVKVLRPEAVQTESLKRFEREAEVLRMLGAVPAPNPNIVRFYDYGVHLTRSGDREIELPFIALEFVDGQTLAKVMKAHGGFGMPVVRVRRLMKQVARALHTLHDRRIVHRDLKPSNILLTQLQGQEVAKVTDFGLVKLPELSAHRTATVAGASLGYAPPEQYEMGNNRVTVQADVFSFAAILYEALSGSEAFPTKPGDNPLRVVARMLGSERPQLARVRATVPRELRDRPDLTAALDVEIARAIHADPCSRHGSIRELWARVEPILREATARDAPSITDETSSFEPGVSSAPPVSVSPRVPDLRVAGRALSGERLRSAALSDEGRAIVALGTHGLYRFARSVWSALHLPAGIDARFIRGAVRLASGELCLYGDRGFAAILANGRLTPCAVRDDDCVFLGAHADQAGVVLTGERLSRPVGVVAQLLHHGPASVETIEGTRRLHAAARLASGALVVCGTHGDLLALSPDGRREAAWGRTGHLYAVAASASGEAYAVGSGGHALRIAEPAPGALSATLEVVQTTRDLLAVHVDAHGTAWAAGAQARLLQRQGEVWTRIATPPDVDGTLVFVASHDDVLHVLAEDGTVLTASTSC